MATKKTVKRIKLSGGRTIVEEEAPVSSHSSEPSKNATKRRRPSPKVLAWPVIAPFRYVKQSWQELRQVRWPSRKATWSLTLAVIIFTMFFVLVILVLDAAFQFLFKEVLLK